MFNVCIQVMQNPDAMLEVLKFACEDNAQVLLLLLLLLLLLMLSTT